MRKQTLLWYLFDFANSFASIVLIFYYPLILSERGFNDAWIGVSTSIATGILLLVFPYLGNISDRLGKRIIFLRYISLLMVVSLFTLAFLTSRFEGSSVSLVLLFTLCYIIFWTCYQGGFVFYSSMLRSMSDEESSVKISGLGYGIGQLGNALCLALIGPLLASGLVFFGFTEKPLAFLIGAFSFALIAFFFLAQKDTGTANVALPSFSYRAYFKKILSYPQVRWFIIAYALISDAIFTFQIYVTLYLKNVFALSDAMVTYVGIAGLLSGMLGAFVAYKLVQYFRSKKKALLWSSFLYALCFGFLSFLPNVLWGIFLFAALAGSAYGFVFSIARALYAELVPLKEQAEYFSIFTVFERAASVVGPLLWILTFNLLSPLGENLQYRGAVFFLMLIVFCGIVALRKVNTKL